MRLLRKPRLYEDYGNALINHGDGIEMAETEAKNIAEKGITIIIKISGYISALFLFFLMTLIFLDVFLRYFFNRPLLGGTELVEFLMALTISLSFGYGQLLKRHVNVEIFYQKLKGRIKAAMDIIIYLLCFGIYFFIAHSAILQADYLKGAKMTSQVLLIPVWPFRVVLAVGAFVYCLALIKDIIASAKILSRPRKISGSCTSTGD
jgi:TRAP-type C4-dicarboxylate transport system permease small subunit